MNKVIFLDIDGVLNCETDFLPSVIKYNTVHHHLQKGEKWKIINNGMLAILNDIIKQTGAKIVLSSTWRTKCDGTKMTKIFKRYGHIWEYGSDVFIGETQVITNKTLTCNEEREAEIRLWAEKNKLTNYVVIDNIFMNFGDRMIHTDEYDGLNLLQAELLMNLLGRKFKYERRYIAAQRNLMRGIF